MPRKKRNDVAAKIEADIIQKAKHICIDLDITLAEYLSDLLRDAVAADYLKFKAGTLKPRKKPKEN